MSDSEAHKILDKLQKIRALRRAREYVKQLEWELYGKAGKPAAPAEVPIPLFLRQHPLRVV